jgi:hypothetical protein
MGINCPLSKAGPKLVKCFSSLNDPELCSDHFFGSLSQPGGLRKDATMSR